ncbi:MAG: efflux RND transporter periplasmic adaptor subunit [Paludibacter sp.]|nr:efflux RND transporter periplasmic adaptor subunit [Paludibacter sp.]
MFAILVFILVALIISGNSWFHHVLMPLQTQERAIWSQNKYYLSVYLMILLFNSCGEKITPKTDPPKDYSVFTLQPRPTTTYSDFPATMQGENIVEIRPMVDGYLEDIYVTEGAVVKKGQLLFKIKNPLYDQAVVTAQAAIKIAIADVNTARMDVEKVRPLVEKNIVSKYELESASFTLQSKEAALAQAYATLANANTNLGYTILRSPQAGIIGSIPYKIGALVGNTTSSPLTILANTGKVFAYFSWNEKQLLSFMSTIQGTTLQDKLNHLPPVVLMLADGSEYDVKGRLETASGLISTETGTASFKAIFPNPKGIIHSGASAVVRLYQKVDAALLVPQSASYELQDKHFVYTLIDGNRVISRVIASKPTNDGQFLIVTEGLKAGDKILLNGSNLKDSVLIIPKYVRADSIYSQLHKD